MSTPPRTSLLPNLRLPLALAVLGCVTVGSASAQTTGVGRQAVELFAPAGGSLPDSSQSLVSEPGGVESAAAHPVGATSRASALPESIATALKAQKLPASSLSVLVQPLDGGPPRLAFNAYTPRNPASVMKLVTTASALGALGPGYQWSTGVYTDGTLEGGHLRGNLYLRGGGDPWLVGEHFWRLLREVRASGVTRIDGALVLDNDYFAVRAEPTGRFDGQTWRAYNAQPAALQVNFHATTFSFRPDASGRAVRVTFEPPNARIAIDNQLEYRRKGRCRGAHRRVRMQVEPTATGAKVRFSGRYPLACGHTTLLRSVLHDARYDAGVFEALWAEMGGTLAGGTRAGPVPGGADLLFAWPSDTLVNAIRSMNKYSNNVMTRQLLLSLGAARFGEPGTLDKGRNAIGEYLRSAGVDTRGFVVDNGAGLSRTARITSAQLGALLVHAWRTPYMPEFAASMSISAVDGTLRRRFRTSPVAGRAHMKTGLLRGVRSLAGYVMDVNDRMHAVVFMQNHPQVNGKGNKLQEAVLEWVHAG